MKKKILFYLLSIFNIMFFVLAINSCGHNHQWSEIDKTIATCTTDGSITYICAECEEIKTVVIKAKGHTEVIDAGIEPTCFEAGISEGKHCSVCYEILIPQYIIPIKHKEVIDVAVEPTCTTTGLTEGKHCSECNEVLIKQEVVAAQHNYIDYVCGNCGHQFYTEGLRFVLSSDEKSYAVYKGTATDTNIVIPATYNGKPVKDISFSMCDSITSIIMLGGITSIGDYAFYKCSSLKTIIIPNSVVSIGNSAFSDCSSLETITIPDSVISIGSYDNYIFKGCSSLTEIIVDKNNKNYCSEDGILYNNDKTMLLSYPAGKTNTSFTIPNSVSSIKAGAFYGCGFLKNISIPDSVTSIAASAFQNCTSLESIIIPYGVTMLFSLFSGCVSLKTVVLPHSLYSIFRNTFSGCNSLETVYYTGTKEEWNNTTITDEGNEPLTNANIIYNYKG